MALPKKKRRTISVDGIEFHYLIRMDKSERAVIQHGNGTGATLFVFPHAIMTPKHVADAIRFAVQRGWTPGQSGQDIWLAFDADETGDSLLQYIPLDDFLVVSYNTMGELPKNADVKKYPDTRKWYERKVTPDNRA